MDSENYILEAYFDLKAEYIVRESSKAQKQMLVDELLAHMHQNEVVFNRVATESIRIFESYDEEYAGDMTNLLVDSVCELVRGEVPEELVSKCQTEMSLEVLGRGLVIGMNFFQRSVLDAIYADINHTLIKEDFLSVEFQNIDYSIFFMFKIYQATQARIFISLEAALDSNSRADYGLFCLQVLVFLVVIGCVRSLVRREKRAISSAGGKMLMVPVSVMKVTNGLLKKITEHFEFNYD